MSVNVCLNLTPQCRSGAPTAEFDGLYWHLHLIENLKRVTQTECDAFHNRANHVSLCMARSDANERGSSMWIQMRRAFPHQIRSPQHPIRSGRNTFGFSSHTIIGIAGAFTGAKLISKPTQG